MDKLFTSFAARGITLGTSEQRLDSRDQSNETQDKELKERLLRLASHGVYRHARRVVPRYPDEGVVPHPYVSEAGKGHMRRAYPVRSFGGIGEDTLAVQFGFIFVAIVFDGHCGIRKLDSRDVNYIPLVSRTLCVTRPKLTVCEIAFLSVEIAVVV
jgi:hypothetical protein